MLETLFANPVFVWTALGLAALPLLVHYFNRRRYRRVPWAAMTFLLAANRRSARRTRFEHLALLLLRTAIIVLAALTLARPRDQAGLAPNLLSTAHHHVLIVDDSASMQTVLGAGTSQPRPAFDHLQHRARRVIDALPAGDRVTVITLAQPPRIVNDPPTHDRAAARGFIDDLAVSDTTADLPAALTLSATVLDDAGTSDRHTVHLLSDCNADLFPTGDIPLERAARALTARARLVVHNLSAGSFGNLAVETIRSTDALAGPGDLVAVEVVVRNHGPRRSAATMLRVRRGPDALVERPVPALDPDATHALLLNLEFDRGGWIDLEAELGAPANDALALDNTRRAVLELQEHIDVLVVDGRPDARRLRGEAGYLVTALAPGRAADSGFIRPTTIGDVELASQPLGAFEAVVLCNVRRLDTAQWTRLREHLGTGAGLIIFGGDLVDTAHYNAMASDVLPVALTPAVPAGSPDGVRFDPATVRGPLATHFEGRPTSGLFRARVDHTLGFDEVAAAEPGRTWLAFDNGRPAIVARRHQRGRVIVVGTSANMNWTNLPARGDFVTLTLDLLRSAVRDGAERRTVVAGERYERSTRTPTAGSTFVVDADGRQYLAEVHPQDDGYRLNYGRLPRCGWYRLEDRAAAGPLAVNASAVESTLDSQDRKAIAAALQCEFEYLEATHPEALLSRAPAGSLALIMTAVLLVLLFVESFVALHFGHQ